MGILQTLFAWTVTGMVIYLLVKRMRLPVRLDPSMK
jgi:hypothetical protein